MRNSFFGSLALFAIAISATARAADMAATAPSAPSLSYNWSGLYFGAHVGGAWTNGSLNIPGNNQYGGNTEFVGGGQLGYNIQAGRFLFGVQGDFDGVI